MRHLVFIIIILFLSFEGFAQRTILKCLSVAEQDGAVSMEFIGPGGTSFFSIYRSTSLNGSYELIHSTMDGTVNTYVDEDINAASQSYSYYIESHNEAGVSGESEKIRTMLLTVVNLNNGLVDLSWNDPGVGLDSDYQIWRRDGQSPFEALDFTLANQYTDTTKLCSATLFYQIKVITKGCLSISNVRGGLFEDHKQPDLIIPENASIDPETGEIRLSWLLPSIENSDIRKYMIWIMNDEGESSQFPIAEVYGYTNLSINLEQELACDTTLTFSITAQDSCGNSCIWLSDYFIRTVNMYPPEYNICNDQCLISWDSLVNWQDVDLDGIRVYQKVGDGEFEVVAEVGPYETETSLYGFERDVEYSFYVEAFSNGNIRSSTSCIKKIIGKKPVVTEYAWLRRASVIEGKVELKWQVDTIAYIPQYAIARSENGMDYEMIDTIPGNSDTIHFYQDLKSRYYQNSQYYKIFPFDSCLNLGLESNPAITMSSDVSSYAAGEALIEWTPYSKMDSIISYQVYRVIDTLVYPFPIGEVSSNSDLSYIDNYDLSAPLTSKVGYFVEAVGYFTDSMPEADTCRSNLNFLAKLSNVFVPTGFDPQGGVTNIFIPIYTGIKMNNYSFQIFNRWGMMIFESNQPVLGWNGKYLGEYVMPGAYAYVISYETLYGKRIQKSGAFFVL